LRGSKGVGVTIESYGKVESLYIKVDNFYYACFGSLFENGRYLENFEDAELLL
jgi:hypothetical protein